MYTTRLKCVKKLGLFYSYNELKSSDILSE